MQNIKLKRLFSDTRKKIILTSESNILKSREKLEFWRSKNIAIATGKQRQKKTQITKKIDLLFWLTNLFGI